MNVYKKLQSVRSKLQTIEIKESGNNRFAGYTYMELGDFLPTIVDLCNEHGLCSVVSFADMATLTIINSDKPEEQIVFTSPMSTAELKGCHAIQNLGAVETYLRRYLYVNAFDIVEHDALDSTQGKEQIQLPKKPQQAPHHPTQPASAPQQGQSAGNKKKPATAEQLRKIEEICTDLSNVLQIDSATILRDLSEFEGTKGPDWLTWETIEKRCTAGWAGKVISEGEKRLNG